VIVFEALIFTVTVVDVPEAAPRARNLSDLF
jgi:hypothetical protein